VWESLLHTFSIVASLSPGHKTAICNAISSFLDLTSASRSDELRRFALSDSTWFSVFDITLDVFDDVKTRSTRQVLATLSKLLIGNRHYNTSDSAGPRVVRCLAETIILAQPRSRLKGTLHALEWFWRKGAITIPETITISAEWLWTNDEKWVPLLRDHCMGTDVPVALLVDSNTRSALSADDVSAYVAQILALSLLLNAREHDRSLIAGTLFSKLCCGLALLQPGGSSPFWVAPLKYTSLMSADSLELITNFVYLPLFKANAANFMNFLDNLPLESVQSEGAFDDSDEEVTLLFSALEVGKGIGLVKEDSQYCPSSLGFSSLAVLIELSLQLSRLKSRHPSPTEIP
jgi:hypothetical protein